jgi:hypothetical protein
MANYKEIAESTVMGIEGLISFSKNKSFSIGIDPPVGSIRPSRES